MKLLTYAINKKELTGVLNREGTFVYPLSAAGMEYRTMKEVIREIGPSELELLDHISGLPPYEVSNAAPLEDIKIMAPIPVPGPGYHLPGDQLSGPRGGIRQV